MEPECAVADHREILHAVSRHVARREPAASGDAGRLDVERTRRYASAAAFDDTIRVLRAFADAYGDVRENPTGASRFDGLYAAAGVGRSERLWVWLARQR